MFLCFACEELSPMYHANMENKENLAMILSMVMEVGTGVLFIL